MKLITISFGHFLRVLALLSIFSTALYANENCINLARSILKEIDTPDEFPAETRNGLRQLSQKRISESGRVALTQKDIEKDQKLYRQIKGEEAPAIFKDIMVDGVRFVDHELYLNAKAGIVKMSDAGEFISMRADIPFKGKNLATNIGLNRGFFISNYQHRTNSLVTKEAKAVVIFMHGGGTKTTGHHVAAQLSNHLASYQVDVISLDMPWHAEGPREYFKNADEFVGWMRAFIEKYILESGKPVFLAGHSMGGEMANIYLRSSNKSDKWVKGVIALSPPVDPVPEVSDARGKLKEIARMWRTLELGGANPDDETELVVLKNLKQKFQDEGKTLNEIGNTDEGILDETTYQGKNNSVGVLFEQVLTVANTWKIPDHLGDDYLPSLFAWGKYDYLLTGKYRGYVDDYIAPLTNVDLKLYGHRETVDGRIEKIGHLIFDHYDLERKDELESYLDIRKFISKVIQDNLNPVAKQAGEQEKQLVATYLKEYAVSLDFRTFVETATLERKTQIKSPQFEEMVKELTELSSKLPDKKIPDAQKQVFKKRITIIKEKMRGSYIPEGESGDFGREIQERAVGLEKKYLDFSNSEKELMKFYMSLAPKMNSKEKALQEKIRLAVKASSDSDITARLEDYQRAKIELSKETVKLNQAIDQHLDRVLSLGDKATEDDLVPSQELYQAFRDYEYHHFDEVFVSAQKNYESLVFKMANDGKLGEELALAIKKFEDDKEMIRETRLALDLIEYKKHSLQVEIEKLRKEITLRYSSDLWSFEKISLRDILNGSRGGLLENSALLQEFWKMWKAIN